MYQDIRVGQHVEVKGEDGYWYTVKEIHNSNALLFFGDSDNYAGSVPVTALKPKHNYSWLNDLI